MEDVPRRRENLLWGIFFYAENNKLGVKNEAASFYTVGKITGACKKRHQEVNLMPLFQMENRMLNLVSFLQQFLL